MSTWRIVDRWTGFEHFDADSVIVDDECINLIRTWDEDVSEYNFLGITFESFECGCAATSQASISNWKSFGSFVLNLRDLFLSIRK